MKVLLDTDTCIHMIRRKSPEIVHRIKRYSPGDVGISSITLAELSFGAAKSSQAEKNRAALSQFIIPLELAHFDDRAAWIYGSIRVELEKTGSVIGSFDMLIAAHALSLDTSLVTHNTREFSRIPALRLVDWIAA